MSNPFSSHKGYRLSRSNYVIIVICLPFVLTIAIAGTVLAFTGADEAPLRARIVVLLCSGFIFALALRGVVAIIAYFRARLYLDDDRVTWRGVIGTKSLPVDDITRVTWRRFGANGRIVVRTPASKLTIDLENFGGDDQNEIFSFFRFNIPAAVQHGWPRFAARILPSKAIQQDSPETALVCALLLFVFGGIFVYSGVFDLLGWRIDIGALWVAIGIITALGGGWFVWRVIK